MRSHFSAFLRILSNVNTRAHVIYATYFHNAAYMPHILAHISPNSVYFPAYFAPERPAYFKKNFRYKPVSLKHASGTKPVQFGSVGDTLWQGG